MIDLLLSSEHQLDQFCKSSEVHLIKVGSIWESYLKKNTPEISKKELEMIRSDMFVGIKLSERMLNSNFDQLTATQ